MTTTISAAYDPADDKIRLRASARLDGETYQRVKSAGFSWAPKQECFYAVWNPTREDLAEQLAGEIEEEGTTRAERAEQRVERFEGYEEKRAADAEGALKAVATLADNIPLGQPILVGHHSERHARRDAERIRSGMAKAVKAWKTSEYWRARAAGALSHAERMERPDVRARRIKTLEAEGRKQERAAGDARKQIAFWSRPGLTLAMAKAIAGDGRTMTVYRCYPLADHPRQPPASQYEGEMSLWSALDGGVITAEQARAVAVPALEQAAERAERWAAHIDNRLVYERAMLEASGWKAPAKPKTAASLPLLNYSGEVSYRNMYRRGEVVTGVAVGVTKAQLAAVHADYKGTRVSACGTHRVRVAMHVPGQDPHGLAIVYLTDSKQHPRPSAEAVQEAAGAREAAADAEVARKLVEAQARAQRREEEAPARAAREAAAAPFKAIEQSLNAGVQVVSAPQLFPTPAPLAARMVALADIQPGMRVLEPSAGTGALVRAIQDMAEVALTCVEVSERLAAGPLHQAARASAVIVVSDFRTCMPGDRDMGEPYDRVLMNPPFVNGADIEHIRHALRFLAPGGRLVALCADGPRQREQLRPEIEAAGGAWESLGDVGFAGTHVRVALVVVDKPATAQADSAAA